MKSTTLHIVQLSLLPSKNQKHPLASLWKRLEFLGSDHQLAGLEHTVVSSTRCRSSRRGRQREVVSLATKNIRQ